MHLGAASTFSINDLEDVEDVSTAVNELPEASEAEVESTQQIYSTYYRVPEIVYNPDLSVTNFREQVTCSNFLFLK